MRTGEVDHEGDAMLGAVVANTGLPLTMPAVFGAIEGGGAVGGALGTGIGAMGVLGAGLAGLGAGTMAAAGIDKYGHKFTGEYGEQLSAFGLAAEWGHGAERTVDGWMGDSESTLGTVAGGAVAGLSSIPLALAGAVGGVYDWITD